MEVSFFVVTFDLERILKDHTKNQMITYTSTPHHTSHHKSLNTSLEPSVKGYPKILQVLEYLNNENQITKTHWKNVVTKPNCNTCNQICNKITLEEEQRKTFGSTVTLLLQLHSKYITNYKKDIMRKLQKQSDTIS